nr:unnamed protein product [Brassica oleracea]
MSSSRLLRRSLVWRQMTNLHCLVSTNLKYLHLQVVIVYPH